MLRKLTKSKWFAPAFLFFFTLISYGIYLPRLGLFGDDWIYLYSYHVAGSAGYPAFVAYDRPYSAWIYQLTSTLFAERVWMYHTFLLILRWLSGLLCWSILTQIWPKERRQTLAIATIFAIFPAFLQQAIPLEFILHFSIFNAFLFSIYLMILAVKVPERRLWFSIPAVLLVSCHFSIEYFVGLEFIRPILLYVFIKRTKNEKQKKLFVQVLKTWLPYLAMLIAFGIWRIFIFKFPSYEPHFLEKFSIQPIPAILELLSRIWTDFTIVFYRSWAQIFTLPSERVSRVFWILLIVTFAASFMAFSLIRRKEKKTSPVKLKWNRWPVISLLSAILLFLSAGGPFWVTEVPLELTFPWDRTILAFMLAASFGIVGLIDLVIRPKLQPVLLAIFLTFSVAFHYFNTRIYEKEHKAIQQYFWQLSWRIPELKPGTLLLTQDLPLYRESDNDLGGTINWMFAPQKKSTEIDYLMFDFTSRDKSVLPVIQPDLPVSHTIRSLSYESNTSEILSAYWNGHDCVWLLFVDEAQPYGIPAPLREYTVLSEPDQIITNPTSDRTVATVLADEPAHEWCYFYQKAQLAKQLSDWEEVIRLAQQAQVGGYQAVNGFESLPFLEAYLHTGDYEQAFTLSEEIQRKAGYEDVICDLWSDIFINMENDNSGSFEQNVQETFRCNP